MRDGDIILTNLPQWDGNIKLRPVLLLKQLPGYSDFLVCGISTQLYQLIKNFDELIDEKNRMFIQTGLRQSSIIWLGFLGVIPKNNILVTIDKIDRPLHKNLQRLAKYLLK